MTQMSQKIISQRQRTTLPLILSLCITAFLLGKTQLQPLVLKSFTFFFWEEKKELKTRRHHEKHDIQEGGINRIKAKYQTQYVAGKDVDYLLLK